MEAPFRFPITGLADVERLFEVLSTSPSVVSNSLRLTEGQDLLTDQLIAEGRLKEFKSVLTGGNFQKLFHLLWQKPLREQHPRYLRFNAASRFDPDLEFSLRIDVPTISRLPRWVDLEGSRDPTALASLRKTYRVIGQEAQLNLVEV